MRRVAAAIIKQDGKILIAKRKRGDEMGGQWEFPGGTVQEGETPAQAMKRELKEELGVNAEVGRLIGRELYPVNDDVLELWFFEASIDSDSLTLSEHEETKWVCPAVLEEYDFPPADRKIVQKLTSLEDGH